MLIISEKKLKEVLKEAIKEIMSEERINYREEFLRHRSILDLAENTLTNAKKTIHLIKDSVEELIK
jgi:hypothetical protein